MRGLTICILFTCVSMVAIAQLPGGGGRPGGDGKSEGRKGGTSRPMEKGGPKGEPRAAPQAMDPMFAIEHELPSLGIDLHLTTQQAGLWMTFEREVRDVAQLSRMRLKRFLPPPDNPKKENEKPAIPRAIDVFTIMADEDRQKADAMTDLLERLKPLYASLDDKQRMLFDKRIVQAQREPLGVQ